MLRPIFSVFSIFERLLAPQNLLGCFAPASPPPSPNFEDEDALLASGAAMSWW